MTSSPTQVRPWRNSSPGDLRPCPLPEKWLGQAGVDDAPGGPFAIFVTPTDGWRALAVCLLTYQDVHHLRTVHQIIGRFAPALENDTGGYVSLVCKQIGVGPDDTIDVHQPSTMTALVSAIALAEGGHLPWDTKAKAAGVFLALGMAKTTDSQPAKSAEEIGQNPQISAGLGADSQSEEISPADALNAAELERVQS